MGVQHFYDKGPHPLLWACSWAACGKITISGVPNHVNYCVFFIVYMYFSSEEGVCMIQLGRLLVGDPCITLLNYGIKKKPLLSMEFFPRGTFHFDVDSCLLSYFYYFLCK